MAGTALWSIYSYFGIVWKQNIMNKLNLLKVKFFGMFVILILLFLLNSFEIGLVLIIFKV